VQSKFEMLENSEVSKFEDVWEMKENRIFSLTNKLLDADRVIQEQLLGWNWLPPNESIFKFESKTLGADSRSNMDSSTLAGSLENDIDDEASR